MAGPVINTMVLGDQLQAHLTAALAATSGQLAVSVYRGEPPTDMPLIRVGGSPDPSGRIAPYVVLFDGAGAPSYEVDLAEVGLDLVWSPYMIVGAGFEPDCSNTVSRVREACFRWFPTVTGLGFGLMKPPPGYDPGPLRRSDQVMPPRWWSPLQWQLRVTAS